VAEAEPHNIVGGDIESEHFRGKRVHPKRTLSESEGTPGPASRDAQNHKIERPEGGSKAGENAQQEKKKTNKPYL